MSEPATKNSKAIWTIVLNVVLVAGVGVVITLIGYGFKDLTAIRTVDMVAIRGEIGALRNEVSMSNAAMDKRISILEEWKRLREQASIATKTDVELEASRVEKTLMNSVSSKIDAMLKAQTEAELSRLKMEKDLTVRITDLHAELVKHESSTVKP